MKIGKMIRKLRKEKDMTLEELPEKSEVALATLSVQRSHVCAGGMTR